MKLTDETFSPTLDSQRGLVIVDFWAPWCGPCRVLGPVIKNLAIRYAGRATFAEIDVDENQGTAARLEVRSIPALLFFNDGVLVDRTVGALPESVLAAKIDRLLMFPAPATQAA